MIINRFKKSHRNQKGFSMIEMMISMAIFSIFMIVIYTLIFRGDINTETTQTKILLQEQVFRAMEKMKHEIRTSAPDRILFINSNEGIEIEVPDPGDLITADFSLKWASAHTIQYTWDAVTGILTRTDATTGFSQILVDDVIDLDFQGDSVIAPDLVTITMTMQKALKNGRLISDGPIVFIAQADVKNLPS